MAQIKKVLIANRGEIAVRLIRSCREMGIQTVAVYSDVDRISPHVLMADEAYHIGPAIASESYLRIDKIIEVAQKSGADAIHPGYGFFAENAGFAQKVLDDGLIFIGPLPETIRLMGSKTESRKSMMEAGVPVVPGTMEAINSVEEAKDIVDQLGGYPILIKAAAGGGGKGMRLVRNARDLPRSLEQAQGEALKAFSDATVYIEKFIDSPKHIEFQIFADQHGNAIHLWERDCSVQRRHQKVIEECPSAILTPQKREEMGAVAVQAAKACNYANAGTVEFLYDKSGNFYFLEMNTRLQVEHPVTEIVMGLDLVKLQIQVAEGQPLPFTQEEVQPRGHAMECRINAEDVFNNFAPSTGKIKYLKFPDGPGVRIDSGIAAFSEITTYYDPIAAKLITWAGTRRETIQRMKRALLELEIEGIKTTVPFCLLVLDHPEFINGRFNINFVESYWADLQQISRHDRDTVEIIAAAIAYNRDNQASFNSKPGANNVSLPSLSPWKMRALKEAMRTK
jgi:acetyl-CoA carboxylase biotin carboxylase subunit